MKSNIFAIYKGKEYQAGMRADGSVILRSNDEKDINDGFINNTGINKSVKCYKYNGYEFSVIDQNDDMLLISTMTGNYKVWLQLGMESVDKGVYQKWVDKKHLIIKIEKEYI